MAVLKILLLFVTAQLVVSRPTLLKEIKMKRNFELSLKPIKFKPITFIKEILTPHAHIIKKHVIERRSPEEVPPEVLPVQHVKEEPHLFKVKLEKSVEAIPPVLPPTPHIPPPLEPPPVENEVPPHRGLITVSHDIHPPIPFEEPPKPKPIVRPPLLFTTVVPPISTPRATAFGVSEQISSAPPPYFLPSPSPAPLGPVIPGLNPTPIAPSPVEVVAIGGPRKPVPGPPPPAEILNVPSIGSLLTDITRVDKINSYLKAVDGLPLIKPPLEENLIPGNSIEAEVPKDTGLTGSLVKGSRLALYFGNILLQVMSEVISSARSAISQYSKPAPI